ncbi:beta-lactamase/transpeptidase-like protein [Gaertneriomyces semiglobifer]|nr:beta-lactamase/transpeptidase-like protein [Gaertneriomyces semiglobifer]
MVVVRLVASRGTALRLQRGFCRRLLLRAASGTATTSNSLASRIDRMRSDFGAPGCAVAVVKGNGDVVFSGGWGSLGVARPYASSPVTDRTPFAIGSIAKTFTALAIATLVQQGKLSWQDRVRDHLPSFVLPDPLANEHTTVEDILCHRTGMPGHDMLLFHNKNLTRAECVERLRLLDSTAPFRTTFQYNNLMYVAATELVSKVSGKDFYDYLNETVYVPLGMGDSSPVLHNTEIAARPHAAGTDNGLIERAFPDAQNIGGAGMLYSNALDMARYMATLLNGGTCPSSRHTIVEPSVLDTLFRPRIPVTPDPAEYHEYGRLLYGLGWMVNHFHGRHMVSHGGNIAGYSAWLGLLPQDDLGVVVLTNREVCFLNEAAGLTLMEEFLTADTPRVDWSARYLKTHNELQEQILPWKPSSDACAGLPTASALSCEGTYVHKAYGTVVITSSESAVSDKSKRNLLVKINGCEYKAHVTEEDDAFKVNMLDYGFAVPGQFHRTENSKDAPTSAISLLLNPAVGPYVFTRT